METEIWKDINGYEWKYQISNLGRVKSLNYMRSWREIILKSWKDNKWRSRICIYNNNIKTYYNIHRITGIHFIPNPYNLPCVCHKDETLDENWRLYNWAENLFWGTYKDNTQDMVKKWRANNHLQLRNPNKWKFWKDHFNSKIVYQYSLDWEFIREWWSARDVLKDLWISNSNISICCRWKTKTAGGFIWRYVQKEVSILDSNENKTI